MFQNIFWIFAEWIMYFFRKTVSIRQWFWCFLSLHFQLSRPRKSIQCPLMNAEPSIWQDALLKESRIKRFVFKTVSHFLISCSSAKVSNTAKGTTVLKAVILKPVVVCHGLKYHTQFYIHTQTHIAICTISIRCACFKGVQKVTRKYPSAFMYKTKCTRIAH